MEHSWTLRGSDGEIMDLFPLLTDSTYLFSGDLRPAIEALGMVFTSVGVFEYHLEHAAVFMRHLDRVSDVFSDRSLIEPANEVRWLWLPRENVVSLELLRAPVDVCEG